MARFLYSCTYSDAVPVSSLATLLSYEEIKKIMPWLARLIDSSPRLAAIVQNSLPSLALITFNGLLPFLLECKLEFRLVDELLTKVTSCRVKLYAGIQEQECNRILFNEEACYSHLVKQLHN